MLDQRHLNMRRYWMKYVSKYKEKVTNISFFQGGGILVPMSSLVKSEITSWLPDYTHQYHQTQKFNYVFYTLDLSDLYDE